MLREMKIASSTDIHPCIPNLGLRKHVLLVAAGRYSLEPTHHQGPLGNMVFSFTRLTMMVVMVESQ